MSKYWCESTFTKRRTTFSWIQVISTWCRSQPMCCMRPTTRAEGRKYIHPRSHVVVLRYGGSNKHRAHLWYLWPWLKLNFAVDKANRLCYWRIDHEPDRSWNLRAIDLSDRVSNQELQIMESYMRSCGRITATSYLSFPFLKSRIKINSRFQ